MSVKKSVKLTLHKPEAKATLTLHNPSALVKLSLHTPGGVLDVGKYDSVEGIFEPGKDADEASKFLAERRRKKT